MGYGAYSHAAHVAMTHKRSNTSRQEIFSQSACHPHMNPHGMGFRDSRDSEAHPNSVGIIFALDVSGSMGNIPARLASDTLPAFMKAMLDAGVADPQVLFMGIGNAVGDRAPLQVGQFESTASLMDQWLTSMYLEGGGGGGNESYELAFYVAARHTRMDCVQKRGRRGYLFITGDEPPNPVVSARQVNDLVGDAIKKDIPFFEIIEETQRTFEPFYLIPDPSRARNIKRAWRDLLGDRVIVMDSPDDTSYVSAGLVSLIEGSVADLGALVQRLVDSGVDGKRASSVARALTPFAASIGKDGAADVGRNGTDLPRGSGSSGYDR